MHINVSSNGFYYKNIHEIINNSWVKEMFHFNKINITSWGVLGATTTTSPILFIISINVLKP